MHDSESGGGGNMIVFGEVIVMVIVTIAAMYKQQLKIKLHTGQRSTNNLNNGATTAQAAV
jgi:hypothetical protein